jgi:preprotein translocase subunit SecA
MPGLTQRITELIWLVNGGKLRNCVHEAQDVHGPRLARVTDGEFLNECARVLDAPKLGAMDGTQGRKDLLVSRASLGTRDAEALALAAEAFSRFPPADLPRGSRLSDEQVLAAAYLMAGSLVQMDTGEGKTFAISTAAFALLRLYERVYVVTANEYLASRDARQTAHFWHSVDVSVGLGLRSNTDDGEMWASRIVYTTLSALQFRSMEEDIADAWTERTTTPSAALLDEADAVLLDQSDTRHRITRPTAPTTKDWSAALRIAAQLEDEHVVRDAVLEPSVTLTPAGEQHVVTLGSRANDPLSERLMLLRDVELSYAATHVAREGHDYIIRAGGALKVDPATGFLQPGQVPEWMPPLEQSRGLAARPRSVERHATAGMPLLWRFEHLAGASGTVINESLDYLLLVGLTPVVIRPRVPRHKGSLPDVYAADLDVVYRWITEQVVEHAAARPILIATDSIGDAEALAEKLAGVLPQGASVRAVSGKTIAEERVFERAGKPGVTIVSTRVAGRGVDVRLSPEARAAGGPLLISIGHAPEARLDRQLLGRVGRNGDPYAAQFVNHPDDAFTRLVSNRGWLRKSISLAPDSVVESKFLTRQLTKAQRRYRFHRLSQFAGETNRQHADQAAYELLRGWRRLLPVSTDGLLPAEVVRAVVDRYIAARFPGFVHGSPDAVLATDEAAAELALLAGDPGARVRLSVQTTGQRAARSREIFTEFLTERVQAAMTENLAARERMRAERSAAERAVVDVRLLGFLKALLEQPTFPDTAEALGIALAAGTDEAAVAVSSDAREEGLRLIEEALGSRPAWEVLEHGEIDDVGEDPTVRDVVADVAEFGLNGAGASPDRLDRLRDVVERAYDDRVAVAARLDARWRHHELRSPWAVASESIDRATQRVLAGLDRTRFVLSHTTSGPTYFRLYRRRIEALCGDVEATLSAEMIGNLGAARDPAAMDELFAERDHQVRTIGPRTDEDLALPPSALFARRPRSRPPSAAVDPALIIEHFVDAMRGRMGDKAPDKRAIYPVLNEILLPEGSSAVLTEPDKVAEAYARYKNGQARERIPPFRRRRVDKQVRLFFHFLHERGLAAPIPTGLTQRSVSLARRIQNAFSVAGLGIGSVALLGAAALCVLLAVLPGFDEATPAPELGLLDRIVSAGALSAGSALGPALLAVVGAAWARWLAGFPPTQDAGQVGLERMAAPVLLVVGAVLVVRPGRGGIDAGLLGALASVVILVVLGTLVRSLVWIFESMVHFHLTAGLAAGFAAFAAMPWLARLAGWSDVLLVAGVTAAATLGSLPLRRARLQAVAIHVDQNSPDSVETLEVPLTVRARLSIVQHATALLLAWVASCVVINGAPALRAVVAGVAYFVVLAAWARVLSRSATDPDAWREAMRARQRTYAGTPAHPTLETALLAAKRRLTALELGTAVLPVAVASVLAASMDASAVEAVPVGVAAVACSVFAVELGRAFVNGFRLPLAGTTTSASQEIDDTESFTSSAQAAVRLLVRRLGYLAAIVGALRGISDVLGIWSVVESIAHWIGRTLS